MFKYRQPVFPAVLAAAACAAFAAAALAQPQPAGTQVERLQRFDPDFRYIIKVDGEVSPSTKVYISEKPFVYMIQDPSFSQAALLVVQGLAVESIDKGSLESQDDGRMRVASSYTTNRTGSVRPDQTGVDFEFEGHKIRMELKPAKPDLLGFTNSKGLRNYDVRYAEAPKLYDPDDSLMAKLKGAGKKARITVYFGTWCPHCQRHVPFILRVEEELNDPNIEFAYYGIPQGAAFSEDAEAKAKNIKRVPTAVITVDGQEVGRISEKDWSKPEQKLAKLLAGG